jgi:hypothetical protein
MLPAPSAEILDFYLSLRRFFAVGLFVECKKFVAMYFTIPISASKIFGAIDVIMG